jgi:hypothetical protein
LRHIQRSLMFSDEEMNAKQNVVNVVEEWAQFYWDPLRTVGPFDYGDPARMEKGIALWKRAVEVRALRQQPFNVFLHRTFFELAAVLYRLGAKFDSRRIYDEELKATGWVE